MSAVGLRTRCGGNLRFAASGVWPSARSIRVAPLARASVERRAQAVVGLLVDDRGEVRAVDVRVALGEQRAALGDELGFRSARQEDVIDRQADLAGVEGLGPQDALGGGPDWELLRDDRRRFSAELERHRRQVPRRAGHHRPAGLAGAGEDKMVERERRESRAAAAAIGEKRELVGGEIFRRRFDHEFGETLRVFGHLDHRPVAGGENADKRREAQLQREVPRHDDADDAERLRDDAVLRAGEDQLIDLAAARLHPAADALDRVVDAVEHRKDFAEGGLEGAAIAVVGVDCRHDRRPIVLHETAERLEIGDALGLRRLRSLQKSGALRGKAGLEFGRKVDVRRGECGRVHKLLPFAAVTSRLASWSGPELVRHPMFV